MATTARCDPQILLVDDDPGLAAMVSDALRIRGYHIRHAASAADAELALDEGRPDVVVLDLMLPDRYGLVLCSAFKERAGVPVIICTASRRKDDATIAALLGADDFLRKPFSLDELQARIDRALSRGQGPAEDDSDRTGSVHRVGRLRVDRCRYLATVDGAPLQLTPTEFQLLLALARRPGAVLAREELAVRVWECVDAGVLRSLQVHMRRLRSKLRVAASQLRLVSRPGFGYQLIDDDATPPP